MFSECRESLSRHLLYTISCSYILWKNVYRVTLKPKMEFETSDKMDMNQKGD